MKTYPDLSAHCIREKLDLPLRLWYILRSKCPNGRGWLDVDNVHRLSCGNRRQTKAWLRKGENIFWTHDKRGQLWLRGLSKVCQTLGVKVRKRPVLVDDIENLAKFRAVLFKSWFADAGEDGRVISQKRLSEIFGRSPRTLRTWAKAANVVVVKNLAQREPPKPGGDLSGYPDGTLEAMGWGKTWLSDPHDKTNFVWKERLGGRLVLCWRIPNTYIAGDMEIGRKTTLQKVAIRQALDSTVARANVGKRYYRKGVDGRSVARAIQRKQTVYLETTQAHTKTDEVLWERLS